jgi:hypothetical protein
MRAVWLPLLLPVALAAQSPVPPTSAALVRGVLLERDSTPGGQFSVRLPDNQVLRYQYDRKTYVEREKRLIDLPRLDPGDHVEVVSDAVPGSALRYARTVHVLGDPPRPSRSPSPARPRSYLTADRSVLTGNLTYSGVVFRITPDRLVLHTRGDSELALAVRKDTRFLCDGEIVEASALTTNTRVFIRAGQDLYGRIEVYQVIWGKILETK